jgi:hypothetical protein
LLKKISHSRNLLTEFACGIEKLLTMKNLAVLGWINMMAKCLASSQSEHGWRAPLNGLSCNGWNVLGQTFLVRWLQPLW